MIGSGLTAMTAIPSVTPSNGYSNNSPTTSANSSTNQNSNVGMAQSTANIVQAAISLSTEGNIVATLDGGSPSSLTYNASGLLNYFMQAGTQSSVQTASNNSSSQIIPQYSTDQAIVNTLLSSPDASGIYNSSGLFQELTPNTTSDLTNALNANATSLL